jgi:anaerobic magnesium-protoporphyrin IX monomethyl ester cyclase
MAHVNTFKKFPSGLLSDIKMSGCKELFVGLESGNDKTLEHIHKPFSVDTAYKTVCRILDAGIPVKCYFILGFPGETEAEACDTVSFASHLKDYAAKKCVQLRVSPFRFRPYHGTALYDELVKNGWTIGQIQSRNDMLDTDEFNPYDCVSGCYADYDDKTLDRYMKQMEQLN